MTPTPARSTSASAASPSAPSAAILTLEAESDDAAGLEQVEAVTGDHLERFAWRDDPKIEIVWK